MISPPTSSKEEESDELSCTVRSLVMVRNRLPAQVINGTFTNRWCSTNSNSPLSSLGKLAACPLVFWNYFEARLITRARDELRTVKIINVTGLTAHQ